MAIFICDFGTILPAAAVLLDEVLLDAVLLLDVLAPGVLDVPPPDELPLLHAATPRLAIASSGTRYLQPRRLPAVLLR
jgi:hypothetical protein